MKSKNRKIYDNSTHAHSHDGCGCSTKNGCCNSNDESHDHDDAHGRDCGRAHSCCTDGECGLDTHSHTVSCGCGGEHGGFNLKWELIVIAAGILAFIPGLLLADTPRLILLLVSYAVLGGQILWRAAAGLFKGRFFDENVLMSVATIGALALGDTAEAVTVMLLYRIGETLQGIAVARSEKSIKSAMELIPERVTLLRGEEEISVEPNKASPGDRILVRPGERIALDGIIEGGSGLVDYSAISGESVPVTLGEQDEILSGGICLNSPIIIRVTKPLEESMASRIMRAVDEAAANKPKVEKFITRFSRIYTPCVLAVTVLVAVIPPLLSLGDWSMWIHRALLFLVISCPCALVLSVPLTFFAGLARASASGILFKGAGYMEELANIRAVALDKTGTITRGVFEVTGVHAAEGWEEAEILRLGAAVEKMSLHPIAHAIVSAAGESAEQTEASEIIERSGRGIEGNVDGKRVLVGNARMMRDESITISEVDAAGTVIYVAVSGVYAGAITIADQLKEGAREAVMQTQRLTGFVALVTGDNEKSALAAAGEAGIDRVHHSLLPEDKLKVIRGMREERGSVLFVGDGINDAPVLAGADVGMAMGETGTDAAVEAADVVLLSGSVAQVSEAIRISRRTKRVASTNIAFALLVKLTVMALGVMGIAQMWMAVFADVGATLICVMYAITLLPVKRVQRKR